MTIRAAAPGDLDAVMRLAAATPEAPRWSCFVYEGFVDPGAPGKRIFVAEDAGMVFGFIAGQILADVCELESIAVSPQHRRAGVGKALLAALINWARDRVAMKVQLEVRSGNDSAITFYECAGFHRNGLRRGYYRNLEEDAVLMSLDLGPGLEPDPQP